MGVVWWDGPEWQQEATCFFCWKQVQRNPVMVGNWRPHFSVGLGRAMAVHPLLRDYSD